MFYFLLKSYEAPDHANYQQTSIIFGTGLNRLGIPFTASCDYYPDLSGNFLFKKSVPSADTIYVVTDRPEEFRLELIDFFRKGIKIIIFDSKDEWIRNKSTEFISICHTYFMTTCTAMKKKVHPLTFTISESLFNSSIPFVNTEWKLRISSIVVAHRVTNHSVCNYVLAHYKNENIPIAHYDDKFTAPTDITELHVWQHTGRRFSINYLNFLKAHKFIDAHGGYFTDSTLKTIVQWDSWKFWEGFICGCVVISADLDYYNITLPFKLIAYKHYIPIRYDDITNSYKKLFKLSDDKLASIAEAGQAFVLKNYSANKVTEYMLNIIQ